MIDEEICVFHLRDANDDNDSICETQIVTAGTDYFNIAKQYLTKKFNIGPFFVSVSFVL